VEKRGNEIRASDVWNFMIESLEGQPNPYDSNEYYILEHTLYRNTITKFLEDKFGAESKHTNKGNKTGFNIEKLQKIQKSYNSDSKIKVISKPKGEGSEGSEGSWKEASTSKSNISHKNIEISQDIDSENVNISQNKGLEGIQIPSTSSYMPSHPSHPSPSMSELTEEEKAKARAKYTESQSKIRKMKNE
jgi:hypothetical protein